MRGPGSAYSERVMARMHKKMQIEEETVREIHEKAEKAKRENDAKHTQRWQTQTPDSSHQFLDVGNGVLHKWYASSTGIATTFIPGVMIVPSAAQGYICLVPRPAVGSREEELQIQVNDLRRLLNAQGDQLMVAERDKAFTEETLQSLKVKSETEIVNLTTRIANAAEQWQEVVNQRDAEITRLKAQLAQNSLSLSSGEGGELSEVKEIGLLSFVKQAFK